MTQHDACAHCGKSDQWVSHGYIYKALPHRKKEAVGKRLLCSSRHNKTGCGHTRQLYLANIIPHRRYTLAIVLTFIKALLNGDSIEHAYLQATGSSKEPRHAWRWIKGFFKVLSKWRSLCPLPDTAQLDTQREKPQRSHALNVLLPTLKQLFNSSRWHPIHTIQVQLQQPFF